MSGVQNIQIEDRDDGMRLDRWFRSLAPGLGQGALQKLLRTGQVRVDGKRIKANHRLSTGETVRVPPLPDDAAKRADSERRKSPGAPRTAADENLLPSLVLYRDDAVIIINKPAGLAVQGGARTTRHVDGLLDTLRFGHDERPRLVHRIDKDTSGCLALARDRRTAQDLTAAFRTRDVKKLYWAITVGTLRPDEGRIDAPLFKAMGGGGNEKMVVDATRGDRATTLFRTIDRAGREVAWVGLQPLTGRTHQLRAHLVEAGTPILGDGKYGGASAHPNIVGVQRDMMLHARRLQFRLARGRIVDCVAPPPVAFDHTMRTLGLTSEGDDADGFIDDLVRA